MLLQKSEKFPTRLSGAEYEHGDVPFEKADDLAGVAGADRCTTVTPG